jgi:hypothetical protein
MIRIGLLILVASWVPLLVVGLLDPNSNPIGLGLLAWGGSLVGIVVAAVGLVLRAIRAAGGGRSA